MRRIHSIKAKVMVVGVALVIGAIGFVTSMLYLQARHDLEELLSQDHFAAASRLAAEFDSELTARRNALQRTAQFIPAVVTSDPVKLQQFLSERPALASLFSDGLSIVDANGDTLVDLPANAGRRGTNVSSRDWFKQVKATNQVVIGEPYLGGATRRPLFVIAAPLGEGPDFHGALAATIYLDQENFFSNTFRADALGTDETRNLFVISEQSRVFVAARDIKRILTPTAAPGSNAMSDRYFAGYEGSGIAVSSRGVEELSASKRMSTVPWRVSVVTATSVAFKPVNSFREQAILWALCASAVAAFVLWLLSRRFLQPVEQASAAITRHLASPTFRLEPIPSGRNDEIGTLLRGFSRLQDSLTEAHAQLRISESQLQDIIEYAPIGMATVALDGHFMRVNQALCNIVGYAKDELERLTFQEITYADDLDSDLENVERLLSGELRCYEMEKRYVCKDGRIVWIQLTVSLLRDWHGQALHFIAQIQDIDNRKKSEVELKETKERLTLALRGASLALCDWHTASDRLVFGGGWTTLLGYPLDALRPETSMLVELVHPEDALTARTKLIRHLKGETPQFEAEVRMRHQDRRWLWVLTRGMAVERTPEGRALRVAGTAMDITQRKRAELEIVHLSQLNELLLNSAGEGIFGVDLNGLCTQWHYLKRMLIPNNEIKKG